MSDLYFLVTDREGKRLLDTFKTLHPHGSDFVFKLLLQFYIRFSRWHKKKGRNPLIAFQDLIEREVTGKPYKTDEERIRYLTELIEKDEESMEGQPREKGMSAPEGFAKELNELKQLLLKVNAVTTTPSAVMTSDSRQSLEDFKPGAGSSLVKVGEEAPKKRKSYRDMRKQGVVKKVEF